MNFAIQRDNGQWWTGGCWGVEPNKMVYDTIEELPISLGTGDDEMELIENAMTHDQFYENLNTQEGASVIEIRQAGDPYGTSYDIEQGIPGRFE